MEKHLQKAGMLPLAPMRTLHCLTLAILALAAVAAPAARHQNPRCYNYAPLTSEQADDIAIYALGLVGTPCRYGGNCARGRVDAAA